MTTRRDISCAIPRRRAISGVAALGIWSLLPSAFGAAPEASTPPGDTLANRLATYADALRYEDLDPATVERVKSHLIDTIGCGIAAFDERPVRICREVAQGAGGGNSTIIGSERRTTPDLASFANGAAFRYYDLNDSYVGRYAGHPSDHIAACLAVAEAERASAKDLITAIVLAYEINCRMIDAFRKAISALVASLFVAAPCIAPKHRQVLKLSRKRPDDVDALHGKQFAQLMETDLGFAAHDLAADRDIGPGEWLLSGKLTGSFGS